ncbi:MAG: HU family DNA-binding protein [Nannocystaceae bacterium]
MDRDEIIKAIASGSGLTAEQAASALDAFTATVTDALGQGKKVSMGDFGIFSVAIRAARTGHNPRTNEAIEIPEKKTPKFRPGKMLLGAVEGAGDPQADDE